MSESIPQSPPAPWLAHYGPGVPASVEHASGKPLRRGLREEFAVPAGNPR